MSGDAPGLLRVSPVRPTAPCCRAVELIEAQSAVSQHLCAPAPVAEGLGLRAHRIGSATTILTRKSENLLYNRVIGLGQASPAKPAQIDRVVAWAQENRVKKVAVEVGASARPRALAEWLGGRGFETGHPAAKLYRDDSPLPPPRGRSARDRMSVRKVRKGHESVWVDVVSQVWRTFGSRRAWFEARIREPGWHHYLAWIGGEPVGAGGLYVGSVGATTVGHLVDGVTLPTWRRRGVQTAIIRRRVRDGARMGCTLFSVETAPPLPRMPLVSFRNLQAQGFGFAYLRQSWVRQIP